SAIDSHLVAESAFTFGVTYDSNHNHGRLRRQIRRTGGRWVLPGGWTGASESRLWATRVRGLPRPVSRARARVRTAGGDAEAESAAFTASRRPALSSSFLAVCPAGRYLRAPMIEHSEVVLCEGAKFVHAESYDLVRGQVQTKLPSLAGRAKPPTRPSEAFSAPPMAREVFGLTEFKITSLRYLCDSLMRVVSH
ncbi:MAG: hypothetical protein BJ554DRAFT_5879, partial [Olpidium bornovanus]